jgi:hypothetical protein
MVVRMKKEEGGEGGEKLRRENAMSMYSMTSSF